MFLLLRILSSKYFLLVIFIGLQKEKKEKLKEITTASKLGGSNEDANPRLKVAIQKGKDAGFDGYITKPVNVKELLNIVKSKLPNK